MNSYVSAITPRRGILLNGIFKINNFELIIERNGYKKHCKASPNFAMILLSDN